MIQKMKKISFIIISLVLIIVSCSGCSPSKEEVTLSADVKEVVLEWLSSADDFIDSNKVVSEELYTKTLNISNDISGKYTDNDQSIITDCQALYIRMFHCGTSTDKAKKIEYKKDILTYRNNIAKKIGEKTR